MSRLRLLSAGSVAGAWLASCLFCWWGGYSQGRGQVMRAAVKQYQLREKVDEKTAHLFGVDLCVANGGLRSQCIDDVRRLEKIPSGE